VHFEEAKSLMKQVTKKNVTLSRLIMSKQ